MRKLQHCHGDWQIRAWHKVFAQEEWSHLFVYQMVLEAHCGTCHRKIMGWYGIDHCNNESATIHGIKPKKGDSWDRHIKKYSVLESCGAMAVTAQKYWDGIPLGIVGIQGLQL